MCQIVELRLLAALIELDGTAEAVESITASRSDLADAADPRTPDPLRSQPEPMP